MAIHRVEERWAMRVHSYSISYMCVCVCVCVCVCTRVRASHRNCTHMSTCDPRANNYAKGFGVGQNKRRITHRKVSVG